MTSPDDLVKLARECGAIQLVLENAIAFTPDQLAAFASRIAAQKDAPQPAAGPMTDEVVPWANCETRAPMVRNSLKARIADLRAAEKRCRRAFTKPYMGEPSVYLADAYSEAAEALERRLSLKVLTPLASQASEPEWKGIDSAPYGGTVDAHLIDGSILCGAIRQSDDEWWWRGQFLSAFTVVGWHPSQAPVDAPAEPAVRPRFANVSCSQCGRDFGPGEHGFSHCDNHSGRTPK